MPLPSLSCPFLLTGWPFKVWPFLWASRVWPFLLGLGPSLSDLFLFWRVWPFLLSDGPSFLGFGPSFSGFVQRLAPKSRALRVTLALRNSREIRDAGEIWEDPDSVSKRQQWKTNDADSAEIAEYVECPSAHWMVQLSG